jgi:hypothetical protein
MTRNEKQTCRELIEPALKRAGWSWDQQVEIGPGRVNLTCACGAYLWQSWRPKVKHKMLQLEYSRERATLNALACDSRLPAMVSSIF